MGGGQPGKVFLWRCSRLKGRQSVNMSRRTKNITQGRTTLQRLEGPFNRRLLQPPPGQWARITHPLAISPAHVARTFPPRWCQLSLCLYHLLSLSGAKWPWAPLPPLLVRPSAVSMLPPSASLVTTCTLPSSPPLLPPPCRLRP